MGTECPMRCAAYPSDTRGYVQTLQQQYEDTMGNLDSEINSMKSTVTGNNAAMTAYMDSLSSALK